MTQPLVSVITPCYNHAAYLPEYFEGLLAQTYQPIELILIDDQSEDESWQIIQNYAAELQQAFQRVALLRNDQNIGLLHTMARLQGLIRGDLVCVLESDDFYYPEKIEANVDFLEAHPEMGVVHSDVDYLYEADGHLERAHWRSLGRTIPQGDVLEDLLLENHILSCAFCCRTDLFKAYADFTAYAARGYHTADYAYFLELARNTQFGYIDRSLACYRVVADSISHPQDQVKALRWKQSYYRIKMDFVHQYGASERVVKRANRQWYRTMFEAGYLAGDAEECERGYRWLVTHYPAEYRRWTKRLRVGVVRVPVLRLILQRLEDALSNAHRLARQTGRFSKS